MSDYRAVYGFLNKPFTSTVNDQGKIDKGLVKVVFEEVDDCLSVVNTEIHFDDREEVFLLDGFEAIQDKYLSRLIKINAIPNSNTDAEGQTKYVCFKNQITEVNKNKVCSFINCPLPDPLSPDIALPQPVHTKIFYLISDDVVYGPFILERDSTIHRDEASYSGKLRPMSGKANGFANLKPGYIYKFNLLDAKKSLGDKLVEHNGTFYVTDPLLLNKLNKSQIEYFTQENIFSVFSSMASKRIVPPQVVTAIKKELNSMNISQLSKEAAMKIVEHAAESNSEWRDVIFDVIRESETGDELLRKAVENQQSKFEKKWLEDAKSNNKVLVEEIKQIENELEQTKKEKAVSERELSRVKNEVEEKLSKLGQESGFEEELRQKKVAADAELEQKRIELEHLREKFLELKTLDDLEKKLEKLKHNIEYETDNKKTLTATLESLKLDIEKSDQVLQQRLREMVPYVSSIIQAPIPTRDEDIFLPSQGFNLDDFLPDPDFVYNIINNICTHFSSQFDRNYSPSLISSILVAHHQNLLTIFSGPPGLGKTSFVRILSQILNIGDRFKEVAVGRTWTSEREFIGFYNSLTDKFSPSPSGMYQFLKALEADSPLDCTTQIVLLDEANLSPMEHYAAIILNIADVESSKKIPLGKESITISQSLRIFGTVNHDMTTEPLSARLLDRSPVIPFDLELDSDDIGFNGDGFNLETKAGALRYPHQVYDELFGIKSKLRDKTVSIDPIKELVEILQDITPDFGIPFVISKRKLNLIRNYVEVLTPILCSACSINDENAWTLALDYAVLYFILPPITGNGTGLETRLNLLVEKLHSLELTKSEVKLKDMIKRGKHHLDTFNYFNY